MRAFLIVFLCVQVFVHANYEECAVGGTLAGTGCGCPANNAVVLTQDGTKLKCVSCTADSSNRVIGQSIGLHDKDPANVNHERPCVQYCGSGNTGTPAGTETGPPAGCGCPANNEIKLVMSITGSANNLVCAVCPEGSTYTPADTINTVFARACLFRSGLPENRWPFATDQERPHVNAHSMDQVDAGAMINEAKLGLQNVHRVPDKIIREVSKSAYNIWPKFTTVYLFVTWWLFYQFVAWLMCSQMGLWRYCPGTQGWHGGRAMMCSSHLWTFRRVMLPYECLNICCEDRGDDGSARAPTIYNLPRSKSAPMDIDADRITMCDYPGLPPPAWYKTWASASRDGVCTMGQPIYEDKEGVVAGGIYTKA